MREIYPTMMYVFAQNDLSPASILYKEISYN
jgi:hypothetical protein